MGFTVGVSNFFTAVVHEKIHEVKNNTILEKYWAFKRCF